MYDKCIIVLKMAKDVPYCADTDYIGGDAGALLLAKKKIRMVLACGDYDSVVPEDKETIHAWCDVFEELNPVKDDSDSEHVIRKAVAMGYKEIQVYGGLGGRLDHEYVNLRLAELFPGKLVLLDERNRIEALPAGTYKLDPADHKYVSVFTRHGACISLKNMKYPLDHRTLTENDLYGLSNEITGAYGELTVHEGEILLICTRD